MRIGMGLFLVALGLSPAYAAKPVAKAPASPSRSETVDVVDTVAQEFVELFIKRGLLSREEADALVARVRAKVAADLAQSGTVPEGAESLRKVHPRCLSQRSRQAAHPRRTSQGGRGTSARRGVGAARYPSGLGAAHRSRGDVRTRYELDAFDSENGPFINFQAINSGEPFDVRRAIQLSRRGSIRRKIGVRCCCGPGWRSRQTSPPVCIRNCG